MLQLVWGLFVLLLLAGACAVLASGGKIHAALLPLPLLAGSAVLLYGFGIVGALRVGVALVILLLAAVWVVGLVKLRPAGFAKACREALATPGLVLFLGGAAFFWVLFFVQQPMFTQWDEFTAWGLAPKMVVERGAFYVADPVNLKASFTYPATSLVTFLFQPFGVWSEWACLAALDTLALACVAAATALPRDRWYSGVLVFAAGVLLPYFFRDPTPGAYATQYVNAMADLPMAMLFGGIYGCYLLAAQKNLNCSHIIYPPLPVSRHPAPPRYFLAHGPAAGAADAHQRYLLCLRPYCGFSHWAGLAGPGRRSLPQAAGTRPAPRGRSSRGGGGGFPQLEPLYRRRYPHRRYGGQCGQCGAQLWGGAHRRHQAAAGHRTG